MKIAVTGGIGSGKSTVIDIISREGYKPVSLDKVYSELLDNPEFVREVCKITGTLPIEINGKVALDRKAVADKVFSDKKALEKLNEFTHKKVIKTAFEEGGDDAFYEVPLLFEGGYEKLFDKVIVLMRDKNKRLESAALRDGVSVEKEKKRAENQYDYENNDLSLHIVIVNDGDFQSLEEKVRKVLSEIKQG